MHVRGFYKVLGGIPRQHHNEVQRGLTDVIFRIIEQNGVQHKIFGDFCGIYMNGQRQCVLAPGQTWSLRIPLALAVNGGNTPIGEAIVHHRWNGRVLKLEDIEVKR